MIEADFLREYRIDLREVLRDDSFSWRRFFALLRGLSPQSAYANAIATRMREHAKDDGKRKITDAGEATHYLKSLVTKRAG